MPQQYLDETYSRLGRVDAQRASRRRSCLGSVMDVEAAIRPAASARIVLLGNPSTVATRFVGRGTRDDRSDLGGRPGARLGARRRQRAAHEYANPAYNRSTSIRRRFHPQSVTSRPFRFEGNIPLLCESWVLPLQKPHPRYDSRAVGLTPSWCARSASLSRWRAPRADGRVWNLYAKPRRELSGGT